MHLVIEQHAFGDHDDMDYTIFQYNHTKWWHLVIVHTVR